MSDVTSRLATDSDREMWGAITASFKARRVAEDKAREEHNASVDWSWLPERCPDCRMSWSLFAPVKIHDGAGLHTGEGRCVECKRVYAKPHGHDMGNEVAPPRPKLWRRWL